jgi:citrate synthase
MGTIGAVTDSITITDNRTGESIEVPIADGGVDSAAWRKLLPDTWFFDPALMTTASTASAITDLDGENGILRDRGYPIEQLAEQSTYLEVAYLLIHGELPTAAESEAWHHDITYHTFIHENVRKRFLEGFHHDAHPMGMLVSAIAALSTFYPKAGEIHDPENRHRQIVRLIAKMPTLAAACHRFSVGMPFVYPDNSLGFTENFLSMLWKVAEPRYDANPALARALDVLFILHADHVQNCGTTAIRTVGSAHADPYVSTAAAAAALYGPRHGGANEDVIHLLTEIGTTDEVPAFIEAVKQCQRRHAAGGAGGRRGAARRPHAGYRRAGTGWCQPGGATRRSARHRRHPRTRAGTTRAPPPAFAGHRGHHRGGTPAGRGEVPRHGGVSNPGRGRGRRPRRTRGTGAFSRGGRPRCHC